MARRLALAALALLAGLLLVELAVRFTLGPVERGNFTPVPGSLVQRTTIPDIPYVLRRNAEVTQQFPSDPRHYFDPGAKLTYRTNALGFRGPPVEPKKPAGTYRILGLGDSFTFGSGVRVEDTFLARVQAKLEGRAPRVEIVNAGVMGYDTVQEVALLEHFGLALAPDLVLLCYFLNDTGDAGGTVGFFGQPTGASQPLWRRVLRRSCLFDRLDALFERREAAREMIASYTAAYRDDSPGWKRCQRELARARDLAAGRHARFAMLIFPVLWELNDHDPLAPIHAKIAKCAAELNVPCLDLLPSFLGQDGQSLWVHPTNQHPNEKAHAIAADALLRFLEEQELVPRR